MIRKLLLAGFLGLAVMFLFSFFEGIFTAGTEGHSGMYTACCSNEKNIATALEMYSTDSQGQYPNTLSDLTPTYPKTVPTCPEAGQDTYSSTYEHAGARYTFACAGTHHAIMFAASDHPRYTATAGLERGEARPGLLVRMGLYFTGRYPSEGHPYP